jgi:hypothetical protein
MQESELEALIAALTSNDAEERATALRVGMQNPGGDLRLLPYLEALLEDRTPAVVSIPLLFGEVRWLAAQALLAERIANGDDTPIYVQAVVRPQTSDDLVRIAGEAGVQSSGGLAGSLELFGALNRRGYLPRYDIAENPAAYRK